MRKKILILIVLFFFLSTFTPLLHARAGFTQEVKLATEVPKESITLTEEGKTWYEPERFIPWWQILPGYEIFLSIFGCLYFAFAVQVLLNFLKEERK